MKISIVQNAPEKGNWIQNLTDLDQIIGGGCGADIYVLPEMFATGQYIDPAEVVQTMNSPIVNWLQDKASKLNAAICGTLPVTENGSIYNRLCFAMPDGTMTCYDKHHLFTYSGEAEHFTAGTDRVVVSFRGLRILLLICYDVRFPVWARNVWGDDYDLILVSANWPEARVVMWDILVASRAVENQCYIVAANLVGDDGAGWHYNGHSVAYDTRMNELLKFADNEEGTRIAELSMPVLKHYREALPLWRDTDRKLVRLEFSE
jgi:predicted amidohydrolase